MAEVREILWRQVTDADFFNVERPRDVGPSSGGGQLYFSISFGGDLSQEDLGRFLGLEDPTMIERERVPVKIPAGILEGGATEDIEFRARYQSDPDGRYYIARQNRQRDGCSRHPGWSPERGFPAAPDDVSGKTDPRIPDLSNLKILVLKTNEGEYFADYVNDTAPPFQVAEALLPLYTPNAEVGADGIIELGIENGIAVKTAAEIFGPRSTATRAGRPTSPEIEDAMDETARAAGARPRGGQGRRQSPQARIALERYSMAWATRLYEEEGWQVTDVSVNHSFDLLCQRSGERLLVEVKGTTSDGQAVLLTPNEVARARDPESRMSLVVIHSIELDEVDGEVACSGGQQLVIDPWAIDNHGSLEPTGYTYAIEEGSVST